MMENGKRIKLMGMVYIHNKMEIYIWGNGLMIIKMDKEQKHGQMVLNMKEIIFKEKNMVKVYFILRMALGIKEIYIIMIYKEKECIDGQIIKHMMETGIIIKCKELVKLYGQMVEPMKESIMMIKKMVLEYLYGQILEDMKDNGKTDYNMVKHFLLILNKKKNMENGHQGNVLSG